MSKYSHIFICFGLLLLTCVLIWLGFKWSNFWLLIIGTGLSILSIVHLIYVICICIKSEPSLNFLELVLLDYYVVAFTAITFAVLTWIFGLRDDRFITSGGNKLHLYNDCSTLKTSKNIQPVSTLEGFYHGHFKDCQVCLKHEKEIRAGNKRKREEEYERKINIEREEHRIEMLKYFKNAIQELENCKDPEIIDSYYDDYCTLGVDIDDADQDYYDDEFLIEPSNR